MRTMLLDDGHTINWTLTDSPGGDHVFTKLDGWWGAAVRTDKHDFWRDGNHVGRVWRGGRELTIAGFHRVGCMDGVTPAAEVERLKRAISGAFPSGTDPAGTVRVTDHDAAVTLEALNVQIDGPPKFTDQVGEGRVMWELPLFAGDPCLYEVRPEGMDRIVVSPSGQGSGLVFPLFDDEDGVTTGFLEWSGEQLSPGGTVTNWGNWTAFPTVLVEGDFPSGFVLTLSGDKDPADEQRWGVSYWGTVTPAAPAVIDMSGSLAIGGIDQSWAVADPFWGGVKPNGGQVTFTIAPVSVGFGTATLILRSTYM